jgi:hypothetical protein
MSEPTYSVEVISQAEAEAFLRRLKKGPENLNGSRSLVFPGGFELSGEFSLTARDARSGEVEWEHSEKNLITDFGRRVWQEARWHSGIIAFAPSTQTPQSSRYSVSTDGTQCVESTALTPTNTPATHTKQFSTTFGTPASNRTLATIALGRYAGSVASTNEGLRQLTAFALLTPPKTQTTTQTLEVVYKVSLNPIA